MDRRARAIEELYRRRYGRFHGVLSTISGSYESGHDAVQEAFARALAKRSEFRGEGSLEGWIWQIAVRTALEARTGKEVVSMNGALDPALVDPQRDPLLAAALRDLSPRRRLMIFLRCFADLSYAQIATACGVTEGTVAATLAQARDELLGALEEERSIG
jgi:RNA polymerase sigma-70 factor (ECF subfamily)